MNPTRRRWLATLPATLSAVRPARADGVHRGRRMVWPADHGAHLDTRTEWWYATGWLGTPQAPSHGFQVTFFRSRTGWGQDHPGRLAPRHLLFAHAAVTDLAAQRHWHDQRITRWNGDPTASQDHQAGAVTDDTRVWVGPWTLQRNADGYLSQVGSAGTGPSWSLALDLRTTQPVLLQGDAGFSRKGPAERQASHYYSQPQLAARASIVLDGRRVAATGQGWLDHEWSDEILAADAVGWDWIGLNGFDGSALTAFRLRRADGTALWAGGSHRPVGAEARRFGPTDVTWTAGRRWRSPATGASYPMDWQVDTPVGPVRVRALLDGQELDSRRSTGTVYWEGLSEWLDGSERRIGLGYLEMTGYAGTLRL